MSIQHLRRLICVFLIASAALLAGCNTTTTPPATTPAGTAPAGTAAPGGSGGPTLTPADDLPIPYPAYQPPDINARPTP